MAWIARLFVCAILAAALLTGGAAADAPQRVMSLNLCTDQLALMLAPPERISSVTWLARDPSSSVMAAASRRVAINHAQAEEVLAEQPDLILMGTFTAPTTRRLIERFGYRIVTVPEALSWEDIHAVTRQVGDALGERARAEALLAGMDGELAALRAQSMRWSPRIVAWDGGGASPGRGTLFDSIISAAGARNLAAEQGLDGFGSFDLEALIAADPDAIVEGAAGVEAPSLRTMTAGSAFVRQRYGARMVAVPQYLYSCGTPYSARAARLLRAQLEAIGARR